MPRTVQACVRPELTPSLVRGLSAVGLLSLRLQRGASLEPAGDVISLEVTDGKLSSVMGVLEDAGLGEDAAISVTTSSPMSVVAAGSERAVNRDSSSATWQEVVLELGRTSNMRWQKSIVLAVAGFVAVIGIATEAIHVVVGAMVIAPGFEPIVRISMGLVSRNRSWRDGVFDTVAGYLAMGVGAALGAVLTRIATGTALGRDLTSYLPQDSLVRYWSTPSWSGLVIAFVAGAGGAVIVLQNRSVLTAGVMIALALVPSWSLAVAGAVDGELDIAAAALLRWTLELALVLVSSAVVLAVKRRGHLSSLSESFTSRGSRSDRRTRPG